MPDEPDKKRAIAFIDGQNLFHAAKHAFGHTHPNYDVAALAQAVCRQQGWGLWEVRFYTGVHTIRDNAFWHHYWSAKLAVMGTRGVKIFKRPLKYRNQAVVLPDGNTTVVSVGQEKGIDVRIALDMVRLARENAYDVALLFSQDQDLSEAVDEVRQISIEQARWIKVACAFPASPTLDNKRGVNRTEWILLDQALYDACLDPGDYRKKS